MAVSDNIRSQFVEFIALQGFDDQFIDKTEEKRIIEVGVKNGMTVEESLLLIRQVAKQKGLVIERDAEERAKEVLQKAANDGQISKKEFEEALAAFKTIIQGKIREPEIKQRLKQMILDSGWKAKEGLFAGGSWFSNL